jgi:hypothetical protein
MSETRLDRAAREANALIEHATKAEQDAAREVIRAALEKLVREATAGAPRMHREWLFSWAGLEDSK